MIIKVIFVLFLFTRLIQSQYNPQQFIFADLSQIYSTAVSPVNGDILIGGNQIMKRYNKDGQYLESSNRHTGKVISIFWNENSIISVGNNGEIIQWDSNNFTYKNSTKAQQGVIGSDISIKYIALNYKQKIDQYSLQKLQLTATYFIPQNKAFHGIGYSKYHKGAYLYALAEGKIIKFNQGTKNFSSIQTIFNFQTIDTNPSKDLFLVSDQIGKVYEMKSGKLQKSFESQNNMSNAKYAKSKSFIVTVHFKKQLLIWDDKSHKNNDQNIYFEKDKDKDKRKLKVVQQITGWNCSISDFSQNFGRISVVDSCGYLRILIQQTNYAIPIAKIILIASCILVLIFTISFIVFLLKKRHNKKQRVEIGANQNQNSDLYENLNDNKNTENIQNQFIRDNNNNQNTQNPYGSLDGIQGRLNASFDNDYKKQHQKL